jgi:hypothetical protein
MEGLMADKELYLPCDCHDVGHVVRVSYEDDPKWADWCYLNVQMDPYASFWQRLVIAFKYVFAGHTHNAHWSETILNREKRDKLRAFLDEADSVCQ